MAGEIRYRFELWGKETGEYCGSMIAGIPGYYELDKAHELNEFYDRIQKFREQFFGITESLRVEYVPDPVILKTVPN